MSTSTDTQATAYDLGWLAFYNFDGKGCQPECPFDAWSDESEAWCHGYDAAYYAGNFDD